MLNRNIFCTLYRPFEPQSFKDEELRAKEMERVNAEQIDWEMRLFAQEARAEVVNKQDYRDMVEQQAFVAGGRLEDALESAPVPEERKYKKFHCQNADPNVLFRLAPEKRHARQSKKLLADQALRGLEGVRTKEQAHQKRQFAARKRDFDQGIPEDERRKLERERYMLPDRLYTQSLEYHQAYPQKVFTEHYKHDAIPIRSEAAGSYREQQARQLSHHDEAERERQIAMEQDDNREKRLVEEAIDILELEK